MRFLNGKPVIRCSSLDQLLSCPGSRLLNAKLGDIDTDDRASWEGQWCHYQAARRFIEKHGAMPPNDPRFSPDGTVIDIGLPAPRIPKDYHPGNFAEWIVDYYHRAVMEETPGDWAMEVECEMLYEFPNFWLSGHCDENAVAPDMSALNFDDLKSGNNLVDAAECNWQVIGYAGLFKTAYPKLRRIRGRIVQPRATEPEAKRITAVIIDERGTWNDAGECVSEATIETFLPLLVARIDEAIRNPMVLDTGIKQCRWCVAGDCLACPALEALKKEMKLELTQAALDAATANPDPDKLARWGVAKKILEPKLKKAWELLKAHAEKNGEFTSADGVKVALKDWKGERSFTDKGETWEALVNDLAPERALSCMDISVPAVEKAYAAELSLPLESKKGDSGEKQVQNRFAGKITQKTGKQLTISA